MTFSDGKLLRETNALKILKSYLESITDDATAIKDTIEAETDIKSAIHGVIRQIGDDEILVDGISVAIHALQQRKERCEYRIEKRREAILLAMEAAELPKLILPEATISVGLSADKLIVTDEAKLPAIFFDPQPSKLDRAKLKAALTVVGNNIEGASLSNGGRRLTIRKL